MAGFKLHIWDDISFLMGSKFDNKMDQKREIFEILVMGNFAGRKRWHS